MAGFNLNDSIDDKELEAIKRGAGKTTTPATTTGNPYFNSPTDPLAGQDDLLTAIMNHQQLYDYGQTPGQNMDDGNALALNFPNMDQTPMVPELPDMEAAAPMPGKMAAAPKPKITADPVTLTKQYEDKDKPVAFKDVDDLATMQQQARDNNRNIAAMEGASDIANALAREGRTTAAPASLDALRNLANQPIKDREALLKDNEDKAKRDPNSELSKIQRQTVVDMMNKMGRRQLADSIMAKGLSAKQLEDAFGQVGITTMLTHHEAAETRKAMAQQAAALAAERRQDKLDAKDTQRLDQAGKLIAADIARNNTAFGRNANIIRSSDAIAALVEGKEPNKVTPQQAFEIAKSLDAMLSAGGTTQSGTEHLMPRGAAMKYANVAEFFKNEPQAAMQGGYVKQAMDTIKRERALAQKKIGMTSKALLGSYMDLQKKHPEAWNTMLQSQGIDPNAIGNSAMAAPAPSTTEGDMVKMRDPQGNVRMVKKSMVEAAKAAGGTVINE